MTTQAEMRNRWCPIISSGATLMKCQGDQCNAFNSRPTKVYLHKDGEGPGGFPKSLTLCDPSEVTKQNLNEVVKDDTEEIARLIAAGWKREGRGRFVRFTKPGEPDCWCDAMPANMECLGGGQ